ncbi:MAG: hybrid sensor histidine kinase/response regulator [Burkholderiales bacterium RIFCSPHIGHO2_01_FULL_64_960]|jgi:signal transduction histidine kinase/ActR/RegA family two-component response regulator|uniref:ATP-binding response regulator n=1 Tax=unclassified Acidovorax TaxID=2684926 RepID=UPI0008B0EF74|nr:MULTISPECIES: hybrid sensor histidine kinase/response regulator [unclassified Acidovorax]MBV7461084.1 hybrid sensor histidine kinase/response regulator [Acidovorax sp. sif0632]MBV7466110.1 hybrid sensor histidine kinase/response regulator [Acidovorax sp. sif0613]OGA59060.1 MAG: hybrid sensor histidine kinase/response regulator [Burkholderiales bacterium RIFCSPHIGHO2_01_FULL_64_960]
MTPSEALPVQPDAAQPPTRWGWPAWERDEVLREQVALLRHNFPMTLLASLATALGTLWVMARVAEPQAITVWLVSHALVVAGVYLTLRSIAPFTDPAQQAARKLIACMAAMGLSWGSLGYVVLYWGTPESVIYAIGIISTVSSGALGLGAPLYRAYVTYLTCAIGGVMMAVALAGGPVMWPALFLTGVYYALTGMQARTADRATRRSIALKLENDRLVNQLRAESQRALAAQEAAEKADRDKSRFLAAASHDLRQPLHAMGLFLESLQRSPLNDHQLTVLGHAHAASGAAAEMLTTLLDYSRLEAGVVKVRPDAFAVQPLLTALEQEFGVQADTAGLVYRTRETSAAAFADRSLVGLVMHNFISNALRYTAKGGVLIACRTRGKRLALEVWDTGPGIPRSQWDNIFKEFHQLGNPERDRRKGLGLGLAIVQRLAREMNTSVEVLSQPGRGSVFRLWLDRWQGALEDDTAPAPDTVSLVGLKVLAIDDDEAVRLGMQSLLHSWGCQCITAESSADALECLEDITPDIIITDFRLRHEETGKQVLQALRAYLGTSVPAIIMTGDTSPQRLRDAQSTSALLLHKPVSTGQLRDAMVQLITQPQPVPPDSMPQDDDEGTATTSAAASP